MPTATRPLTGRSEPVFNLICTHVPAHMWAMPAATVFLGRRESGLPVRARLGASVAGRVREMELRLSFW